MRLKKDLFIRRTNMEKKIVEEITITETISVIVTTDTAYNHTEFDEIMAAWRLQEFNRKRPERKRNIFSLFKRKEIA